ncbi:MAG: response regulator [Hyphomicrobiaceae bacterium]
MSNGQSLSFLIVDDDEDDRLLIEDAFLECAMANQRDYAADGVEMLQYLRAEGKWVGRPTSQMPSLILLDLNMPRMDGRRALAHLKNDPILRYIPVIVLTTSRSDEDKLRAYDLGATSFILKPVTFDAIMKLVQVLDCYWATHVELPKLPEYVRRAAAESQSAA